MEFPLIGYVLKKSKKMKEKIRLYTKVNLDQDTTQTKGMFSSIFQKANYK